MLRCPTCRMPLARQGKTYRCISGHSFDVARSGYVNLLRSGSARPRGDDASMLQGRRAFLEKGYYESLLRRLIEIAAGSVPGARLLDIGCGEGYYTGALARAMPAGCETWGLDISKAAVDMAARHHPEANFAVANARDLPIQSESVDVLVCVFGPSELREYARVVKASGFAIIVRPGSDHLVELRRHLYREVRLPGRGDAPTLASGWRTARRSEIRYRMLVRRSVRESLLAMTPYAWSGSEESRKAVLDSASEALTSHFVIQELRPG